MGTNAKSNQSGFGKTALMCLSALIASTALTAPASANGADIVNKWINESSDDSVLAFAASDVSFDALTNKTMVKDLTITLAFDKLAKQIAEAIGTTNDTNKVQELAYKFVVPSVEFTNLQDTGGSYSVDLMTAPTISMDVNFDFEGEGIPPSTGSYEMTSVKAMRWAKIPELVPDKTKPFTQFLPLVRASLDFDFDEMTINKITSNSPIDADGAKVVSTYGPARIGKTVRGDMSEMSFGTFTMSMDLPEEASEELNEEGGSIKVEMTAESGTAKDYNYGTMLDTLFAPAGSGSGDYRTGIGEMVMNNMDIEVVGTGVNASIDSIVIEGVGVKTPDQDFIGVLEQLFLDDQAGKEVDMSEEEIISLVASLYGAFSLGKFEMSGMAVQAPEVKEAKLDAYGLTDLSSDGLGSFYMRGLHVESDKGDLVKYGESAIEGVTFPALSALIALEKNIEAKNVAEVLKAIPTIARIANNGIVIDIKDENVMVNVTKGEILMGDHIGPIPTNLRIDIDEVRLPVAELEDEAKETFEGLGYDQVGISYDLGIKWDESTTDLKVSLDAELEDGGRLTGESNLGSIPRIVFEKPDESAVFSLLATTFKNFDVRFEDNSIVQRGLDFAAKEQGVSADQLKAQGMGMIPAVLAQLNDPELAGAITQGVQKLIDNGEPLAISITAATPLPVVALGTAMQSNPASILQSLDVTVSNQ